MTERGRNSLSREQASFSVGPSSLRWDGTGLTIDLDEVTVPIPKRIRGQVKVHSGAINGRTFALSETGEHRWRPVMPIARVEASFSKPDLNWSGSGYFDHNTGAAALDDGFSSWTWSRSIERAGTTIFYDAAARVGNSPPLALRFGTDGTFTNVAPPPVASLPQSKWRIARATRSDAGSNPKVIETLEDAPFYARSVVEATIGGERTTSMHESLSLERFRRPLVQAMLPFKMPRRGG